MIKKIIIWISTLLAFAVLYFYLSISIINRCKTTLIFKSVMDFGISHLDICYSKKYLKPKIKSILKNSPTLYAIARKVRRSGKDSFQWDSSASIKQTRDKLYSLELLINSGLPIQTTGFANSPLDTEDLIQMVRGAPLIVKLLEGTQGRGVVIAETKKAAESLINAFKSLRENILVQEFVKEADAKDIRCFVVNGKIVESIMRNAALGEFRANIDLGGKAQKIKTPPKERKIAILVAKTFNLKVAGVDIIRGKIAL